MKYFPYICHYSSVPPLRSNNISFWGIFYVDASTEETAKASFVKIAEIAGRRGDIVSAKDWLSGLNRPWLLVVDNADDTELDIDRYIPSGQRGFILVTTRNPALQNIGTIGCKSYHFETLEANEASELVLRESGTPEPWGALLLETAYKVAAALGFLPLALVHAGKAVLKNACRLVDYLSYYQVIKENLRSFNRGTTDIEVYSSFDLLFESLEKRTGSPARDAIDLLRIFSFFYYENISVAILVRAAINPVKEREQQQTVKPAMKSKFSRQFWRELTFQLQQTILKDRSPPNVPSILRVIELGEENEETFKVRLNAALSELSQRSLITLRSDSNDENWTYSMHPLVHEWVRQRPQMSHHEQAVRCQEAITVLGRSILLPPLGDGPDREKIHTELLPHIMHAEVRGKVRTLISIS